jgi:hypothetical protein
MQQMRLALIVFFLSMLINSVKLQAEPFDIVITMQDDVYKGYLCLLNDRNPLDITDFSGACSRRDVVEIILFQQALALGGLSANIQFVPGNYSLRNRRLLETGFLMASVDTFWKKEAEKLSDFILISEPMILAGEYTAGFFTAKSNGNMLATRNLHDFEKFTGVSSKNWTADWQTMVSLQLKELIDEPIWSAQVSLVSRRFVDFMLAPLNVEFINKQDWDLVPVPGIAVLLNDSRHFVFSKNHPLAKMAFAAANKGIKIMRLNGTIHKAYSDAQLFYALEHNFTILNK